MRLHSKIEPAAINIYGQNVLLVTGSFLHFFYIQNLVDLWEIGKI